MCSVVQSYGGALPNRFSYSTFFFDEIKLGGPTNPHLLLIPQMPGKPVGGKGKAFPVYNKMSSRSVKSYMFITFL